MFNFAAGQLLQQSRPVRVDKPDFFQIQRDDLVLRQCLLTLPSHLIHPRANQPTFQGQLNSMGESLVIEILSTVLFASEHHD